MAVFVLFFTCRVLIGEAAEGKVTAETAKIRAQASTDSEVVGSTVKGKTIDILGAVTPFIILGLGWWYTYKQKKDKKAADTENELERMKEKSLKDDLSDAIRRLDQATEDTKPSSDKDRSLTQGARRDLCESFLFINLPAFIQLT